MTQTNEQPATTDDTEFAGAMADLEAELRGEVDATDDGGFAKDPDEALVLRYLRTRSRVANEIVHIEEQTGAILKRLKARLDGLDKFYGGHAEAYAHRKLDGQRVRSVKTPFGTLGFRKTQPNVKVVDEAVVLALAETREDMKACVRVKTELSKSGLNEWFDKTGDVVDGLEFVPAGEKFFVK
jgi:phage host-nuclease inhibitor protein Gam